jgi:ribonuclease HII
VAPEPRGSLRGPAPGLAVERGLQEAGARLVGGMDEVGRGALAGPVTVGLVVLRPDTRRGVPGLRDSKLLSPPRRKALVPRILAWCAAGAVGHASPQEIDALGLTAALRLAGRRALAAAGPPPDVVVLDGRHDWLTVAPGADRSDAPAAGGVAEGAAQWAGAVVPRVRADLTCASVAAASVLAKVERDRILTELSGDWPQYGWSSNKGYGAAGHRRALAEHGPTPHHRLSWRLTGAGTRTAPSTSRDGTR